MKWAPMTNVSSSGKDHDNTGASHLDGSDSFRYAQATYNSNRVPDCELQRQVGRANFTTIQRYTHYAETHRELDYNVFLPESLKASEEWAYLESKPPWVVEKGKSRNTQSPARQGFVSSTP